MPSGPTWRRARTSALATTESSPTEWSDRPASITRLSSTASDRLRDKAVNEIHVGRVCGVTHCDHALHQPPRPSGNAGQIVHFSWKKVEDLSTSPTGDPLKGRLGRRLFQQMSSNSLHIMCRLLQRGTIRFSN